MKHYFKYKSLKGDSFKYFVKMLVEGKMYAARFKDLNDPMEGAYLISLPENQVIADIRNDKDAWRIISLIEKRGDNKPCNMLMWSHYTDEHRGCCVEFHFKNKEDEERVRSVEYVNEIPKDDENSAEDILSRKFVDWKYEQEVRYLGVEKSVPIVIDKIYLGMRVDDMYDDSARTNEDFYGELIKRLCPNVEVVKMRAKDFDNHHINTLKE